MNNENNVQNEVNSNVDQNGGSNIGQVPVQNNVPVAAPSEVVNPVNSSNSNVPGPALEENVIPTGSSEQVVIDNSKKKKGSNVVMILVMILLILFVVYMDEVIAFVEENIIATNPTDVSDADSDNLVSGYVMIDDSTGSIKVNSVKFYNFKKNNESFSVIMNYVSDKNIKVVSEQNLFVEFYNSDKEVLHKELFNVEDGIDMGAVRTYSVTLNSDVYSDVTYALVRAYTESELTASSTLSCKYEMSNEGYNEIYKHDFNFVNDMLVSYNVDKKVEVSVSSDASNKVIANIKSEYDKVIAANLSATYTEGNLTYFIDLENLDVNYIPLYTKGMTISNVKNKEVFKKWECE